MRNIGINSSKSVNVFVVGVHFDIMKLCPNVCVTEEPMQSFRTLGHPFLGEKQPDEKKERKK